LEEFTPVARGMTLWHLVFADDPAVNGGADIKQDNGYRQLDPAPLGSAEIMCKQLSFKRAFIVFISRL
jgi:hypothetical protein